LERRKERGKGFSSLRVKALAAINQHSYASLHLLTPGVTEDHIFLKTSSPGSSMLTGDGTFYNASLSCQEEWIHPRQLKANSNSAQHRYIINSDSVKLSLVYLFTEVNMR